MSPTQRALYRIFLLVSMCAIFGLAIVASKRRPTFAPATAASSESIKFGSIGPSPVCLVNSTSLGTWTATTSAVEVAAGETISVKLADSAGVGAWQIDVYGTDGQSTAPTITQATSVNGTATFTAPSTPATGWALIIRSMIGNNSLGRDANGRTVASYTKTFKLYFPTSGGYQPLALNETNESDPNSGWAGPLNDMLRNGNSNPSMINSERVPWKNTVRAVATSNCTLSSCTVTTDGVTLVAGDRELRVGQTLPADNGIYVVGTVGGGVAARTRAPDFAASADAISGSRVHASEGATYQGSDWYLQTSGTITIGTTPQNWQRVNHGEFDVRRFGARGDWNGTTGTDDQPAFQAAIDAACASNDTGGGHVVLIPSGAYRIASALVVPCAAVLVGAGHPAGGVGNSVESGSILIKDFDIVSTTDAFITFNGANGITPGSGGGARGLRIVQGYNTRGIGGDGGADVSSGVAIKAVALDSNHKPAWVKFSDLIIEESGYGDGAQPWEWAMYFDGSASATQILDMYIDDVKTHTNSPTGGMLYAKSVLALFARNMVGSLYPNVTITGTSARRSAGVRISDSSMGTLTLDYTDYPIISGGSVGLSTSVPSVVVTSNVNANNPGWMVGARVVGTISDASFGGFGAIYIDKTPTNRYASAWRVHGSFSLKNSQWLFSTTADNATGTALIGTDVNGETRIDPFAGSITMIGAPATSVNGRHGDVLIAHDSAVIASGTNGAVVPMVSVGNTTLADGGVDQDVLRLGYVPGLQQVPIEWGPSVVSCGGGSTATMGTIGGSGPTTAGQSKWLPIMGNDGTKYWFPVWQ